MPNKTKAEIRHAKLSAKAESAARKSLKNDKGINKNERLVTKANKLNKRKNLGKDDIAYGMSPYKHSGTKKHNKKHSENPKWKHKDRSAGAIIGRAVNTVKDTGGKVVNKVVKEGGKIIKDAKETIKAGNKMSPYKLKPVPADKQKSLGKLPTEVRNKMGYQMAFSQDNFKAMNSANKMDSSHSFKMGPANNMKTMYMGSVYSMEDPNDPNIVPEGTESIVGNAVVSANAPDFKTVTIPGSTKTVPGKVIGGGYKDKMSNEAWKKYLENETPEQKQKRIQREIDDGVREPNQEITTPGTETTTATQSNKDIAQTFDVFDNDQSRQRSRRVIAQERKAKRAALKETRLSGLKGKDKRKENRRIKSESAQIRNRRLQEIARQGEMQDMQGLRPGSVRSLDGITSDYTQVKRDRDNVSGKKIIDEALQMNLSPKAMNYFNRKKR